MYRIQSRLLKPRCGGRSIDRRSDWSACDRLERKSNRNENKRELHQPKFLNRFHTCRWTEFWWTIWHIPSCGRCVCANEEPAPIYDDEWNITGCEDPMVETILGDQEAHTRWNWCATLCRSWCSRGCLMPGSCNISGCQRTNYYVWSRFRGLPTCLRTRNSAARTIGWKNDWAKKYRIKRFNVW